MMGRILLPIVPLTAQHCDPKCPWRGGDAPFWSCFLFELHLNEENGLARRCALCQMAEKNCEDITEETENDS